jgi:hypothetical protein
MSFPDMPTVCDECEGRNLTLDHHVWLYKVAGSIDPSKVVEVHGTVWLSCNDCSTTLWNGQMADFMPFLNEMRTVLPILMPTLQAVGTQAIGTYNSALAPIFEALTGAGVLPNESETT